MIKKIISTPCSSWTKKDETDTNIVISSRIRLARNLNKIEMPSYQDESGKISVLEEVEKAVKSLELTGREKLHTYRMAELTALEREILLEKHLISPELSDGNSTRGLLINEDESVSIMVNEEDHLRIQVLFAGLQMEKAWEAADHVDNLFESKLDYAFHEAKGYLTSCPTNVGTGLRASVMIHLPALVLTKQAPKLFSALAQLGLAVRGLYGEGTEATGYIYQISNQITLGVKENEIVQNLTNVAKQLMEKEEESRKFLLQEAPLQIADRVGRAYGILHNAAILSTQEALNYLSDVRLGIDLGILKIGLGLSEITELMVMIQPGFLQQYAGRPMEPLERDAVRAKLFKEKLGKRGM